MNNMNPLNCASVLNNMGVHMLDMKNTFGAMRAFQRAVNVMKECTEHLTDSSLSPVDHTKRPLLDSSVQLDGTIRSTNAIRSSLPSSSLQFDVDVGTMPNKSSHNDECYIYDRPLILPTEMSMQSATVAAATDIDVDLRTINASVIILFNLCISCHQYGKQSGQTALLLQTLRVYEVTLRMIQQQQQFCPSMFLQVVMCLTLNNMASIYYFDLCDHHTGVMCMESIKSFLFRYNIDDAAFQFVNVSDWTELKLNALFVTSPSTAQAA